MSVVETAVKDATVELKRPRNLLSGRWFYFCGAPNQVEALAALNEQNPTLLFTCVQKNEATAYVPEFPSGYSAELYVQRKQE